MTQRMVKVPSSVISFDATEGTFMNVDVSPDGETLVIDLLGDIYSLPYDGGEAVSLTTGRQWDQAPRFSPDGESVYFVSDRKGHKNIWRLKLSDRTLQKVTRSSADVLGGPNWSQDGTRLIVGLGDADPDIGNSEITLHSVDPADGTIAPLERTDGPWIDLGTFSTLRRRITTFSGVQADDGQLYFSELQFEQGRHTVRMFEFDPQSQTRTAMTPSDATFHEYKPQLSHDGNLLAYFRQYNDRRTELRILNRTTGQGEAVIELANADDASYTSNDDSRPNYAFTPGDRQLVFWHAGKIHRVDLADKSRGTIPFRVSVEREVTPRVRPPIQRLRDTGVASVIRWPSLSPDGETMVFAAIGYIWVMDLTTGKIRRLTSSNDVEYMPALSPDGTSVAYIGFTQLDKDYGTGRLMIVNVGDGMSREVLAGATETYLLPSWSRDGSKIALVREAEAGGKVNSEFGWTSATTGAFHAVAPAPASSDRSSRYIYSRYVGFDSTGRNLLFSFARSGNETVLVSAGLDGNGSQTLAVGGDAVGGITPAPDLNYLVLTRRDGTVWAVPFETGLERHRLSTVTPGARRVSSGGGYYVNWNRPKQFTFGFAKNVYRYRLVEGELDALRVNVPIETAKATRAIAFTGARLVTMSNDRGAWQVIDSGTVVLNGMRIASVGPIDDVVIPADAIWIDATGKTIMPGFIETHYHRLGGWSLSAFALPNDDFNDRSAIEYGITTAWEPGGKVNDGVPSTADLQKAGRILGPRWSHSAVGSVGRPWERLTDFGAAMSATDQHRELGVVVLKEYNTPTRQQRQWLSAAAREQGLGIVSHLQSFDGMMTRIVDGYTGGDHPYIPIPFFKDVRELLRQTGYIWTPNVRITPGTAGAGQSKEDYYCYAVSEWRNESDYSTDVAPGCSVDQSPPTVPYDILRFSRVARQAALAAKEGVHIGVSAHGMPGSKLHREMWYLWKGGMPVEDVLRATTIGNAEKLGLQEEIGSLEPGKIADFLVLGENPLDDILNTLTLEYTVQGGVVYDSDTALRADLNDIGETTPN